MLFNNAGMMTTEDLTRTGDTALAEQIFTTNALGADSAPPMRMIEHLSAQPDAAIVTRSSGLAFVPLPKAPSYSASKAAMHSWTVSLRTQLAGKVEVIELAPPAVRTELTARPVDPRELHAA